jgi:hypothetical protein
VAGVLMRDMVFSVRIQVDVQAVMATSQIYIDCFSN